MAKATKIPKPLITPDAEQFMAFEGLVQWTKAVVTQSARVSAARERPARPSSVAKLSTPSTPSATFSPLPRTSCLSSETGF